MSEQNHPDAPTPPKPAKPKRPGDPRFASTVKLATPPPRRSQGFLALHNPCFLASAAVMLASCLCIGLWAILGILSAFALLALGGSMCARRAHRAVHSLRPG